MLFSNSTSLKNYFKNTTRVSNNLDPYQTGHFVGSDLGPNCLQRLSTDSVAFVEKNSEIARLAPVFKYISIQVYNMTH